MIYLNKIKRLFFLLLVIFSFSKMFSNIEIENHDFFNINNPTFGTALITGNWSLGETLTADTSDLNDVYVTFHPLRSHAYKRQLKESKTDSRTRWVFQAGALRRDLEAEKHH